MRHRSHLPQGDASHDRKATDQPSDAGRPYLNVNIGADNVLSPGETITVILDFVNPTNAGITYGTRIIAGSGCR